MTAFGKRLIQSAQEAGAIARGEADPSTYHTHTPTDVDVQAIRAGQKLTQAAFAARYGFPIGTLLDIEQGRARPDASSRAYLLVISRRRCGGLLRLLASSPCVTAGRAFSSQSLRHEAGTTRVRQRRGRLAGCSLLPCPGACWGFTALRICDGTAS